MRRLIVTIVICCLLLTTCNIQAMAVEKNLSDNSVSFSADVDVALPLMLEASQVNSYFKINSAGVATIRCEVYGDVEETNRVRISAELQQYKNGEWVTIKTFTKDSAT